jgi:hypothetical protein
LNPYSRHCGKENAMLPLMIGMGVPVFAAIAYALISPDPASETDEPEGRRDQ